jgi:hypothetical protein
MAQNKTASKLVFFSSRGLEAWDLVLTACCCHSCDLLWNGENIANQACQSHISLCIPFALWSIALGIYVDVQFYCSNKTK